MTSNDEPNYAVKRLDDGTWNVVERVTGRTADIGGCVLRRLDADMAIGLAEDLNLAEAIQIQAAKDTPKSP